MTRMEAGAIKIGGQRNPSNLGPLSKERHTVIRAQMTQAVMLRNGGRQQTTVASLSQAR
jgi:hypothetical protein